MTNTELIAEARKFLATPNLGRDMARELNKALAYMWELADALEAADALVKELEAGEWEYRCVKAAEWTGGMSVILPRAHYHADCPRRGFRTERRTTAGPWVPVESEGE